jgi:hypothetical protein
MIDYQPLADFLIS